MSDQLYCPECADKWSGAYNTDHRCVTCGSPLKAEAGDGELERVRAERDALAEQLAEERRADADLRDILDRVKRERDELAANLAAAQKIADEDRVDHTVYGREGPLEHPGWKSKMGRDLHQALSAADTTSLAHLKAQWKAEALELAASTPMMRGLPRNHLRERAARLRHQSQETTP